MNKTILKIAAIYFIALASAVAWEPVIPIPQPEFDKRTFLLTPEIEEMNVDFASQAKTSSYTESDFEIGVWGNTAMVNYGFEISYEMGGLKYNDIGRDLFIFSFDEKKDKWLAIWRMIIPFQKK
jgi:hypothetical protein